MSRPPLPETAVAGVTKQHTRDHNTMVQAIEGIYGELDALGSPEVAAADITDATPTGVDLITAVDAASARSTIGAGTSNLEPGGVITVDGLPILADSSTTWESEATAMARYGLTTWTGRRRWVSIDYPDHPAPSSPNVGDIWDDRITP